MADKLVPKKIEIFASNVDANTAPFGDFNIANLSKDPDLLQNLHIYEGWKDNTQPGSVPDLNHFNTLGYLATRKLKEFQQQGIPNFILTETYHIGGLVMKAGTYELYGSLVDDNKENALPDKQDDAKWKYVGDLNKLISTIEFSKDHLIGGVSNDNKKIIPDMYSNILPFGYVASASSETDGAAWNAFDINNATKAGSLAGVPYSLAMQLPEAKIVQVYYLQNWSTWGSRMVNTWEFQGSNNGSTWDTLDTRSGEDSWGTNEVRDYNFTNTTPYTHYRILATALNGDSIVNINSFNISEQGETYITISAAEARSDDDTINLSSSGVILNTASTSSWASGVLPPLANATSYVFITESGFIFDTNRAGSNISEKKRLTSLFRTGIDGSTSKNGFINYSKDYKTTTSLGVPDYSSSIDNVGNNYVAPTDGVYWFSIQHNNSTRSVYINGVLWNSVINSYGAPGGYQIHLAKNDLITITDTNTTLISSRFTPLKGAI